jgi:hypothetical protein
MGVLGRGLAPAAARDDDGRETLLICAGEGRAMKRSWMAVSGVVLAIVIALGTAEPFPTRVAEAQQFPASAVIRGENIRLRIEPAENADDVAILQRGDAITITGAATAADGDEFYPVEVVGTGETGWVRVLFINPNSIVPIAAPVPVQPAATEPAAAEPNNGGGKQANDKKKNRQNRNTAAEETPAPEQPAAEQAAPAAATPPPATEQPAEQPAAQPTPAPGALTFSGTGAATSEPLTLEVGRYRATATMEVSAPSGFLCNLTGPRNFSETLFDEQIDSPQSWTMRASVSIDRAGDYTVECSNTNDPWTITLEPRG